MSADARVARAIQDVNRELSRHEVPAPLKTAVERLIDEAADSMHLSDEDIKKYDRGGRP